MKKYENINGVINIYKEKGYTSFDAVAVVRKYTHAKVGHTGTLDPEAEGVLPICLGCATRLCDHLTDKTKTYTAGIKLGVITDTWDASGTVTKTLPVNVTEAKIIEVLHSFMPEYMQVPPMYSALKLNGKKLYELARAGIEIERKARPVKIFNISLTHFNGTDEFGIRLTCSKGTYIRSLAYDIGEKLGCGAHMSCLIRNATGNFDEKTSVRLDEFKLLCEQGRLGEILIRPEDAVPEFKRLYASAGAQKFIDNGNEADINFFSDKNVLPGEKVLVFDFEQKLRGIYEVKSKVKLTLKCVTTLNTV